MSWLANLIRRARLRGLVDGRVQTARAESLDDQAHDDAERHQDYGFAANPVEGQGLVVHLDGNTLVLRLDRIAERPGLAPFEVAVWHHEGHMVKLKAGRVVEMTCDRLIVNAATDVTINTPLMTINASDHVELATPLVHATQDVHAGRDVHVDRNLQVDGAATIEGQLTGNANGSFTGTLAADVDVLSGDISLRTHRTGGVKRGTEVSDGPVP